ncbi:MAG: hypothetical protein JXB48_22315 [Candidatus Latescibacteria bacterium]|nr:hypothetical protein [Candidatus Latescibacterota bacterium]
MVATINATPINITIFDGFNPAPEDGNTNFNSVNTQEWDLEAFFYDNATNELSMVSGFNAFGTHQEDIMIGDIFIDLNRNSTWDYVIDLNQGTNKLANDSYSIVDLAVGNPQFADLQEPYDASADRWGYDHSDALPYALISGGQVIGGGTFSYSSYKDFQGTHYTLGAIDMSFLAGEEYFVHQTYSCGNDLLVGNVTEPTIIIMLGLGLLSVAFFHRKK